MVFESVRGQMDIGPTLTLNAAAPSSTEAVALELCHKVWQLAEQHHGVPHSPPPMLPPSQVPTMTMNAPTVAPLVPPGHADWPGVRPVWNTAAPWLSGGPVTGYLGALPSDRMPQHPQPNYAGAAGAMPMLNAPAVAPLVPTSIDWAAIQNARQGNPTRPVPVAGGARLGPTHPGAGAGGVPTVAPLLPPSMDGG